MIQIAILEDDSADLKSLTTHLQRYVSEEHKDLSIATFSNGTDFLKDFEKDKYQIIFLDVQLGDMSGMDVAAEIRKKDGFVFLIFATWVGSLAIKGYQYNAVDYFVKPIQYLDIRNRLDKLIQYLDSADLAFTLNVKGGLAVVHAYEIYYIESLKHDLIYHTVKGDFVTSAREASLNDIEKRISAHGFARAGISFLVNLKYCEGIDDSDCIVHGNRIPISRSKKKEFVSTLVRHFQRNGGFI